MNLRDPSTQRQYAYANNAENVLHVCAEPAGTWVAEHWI